MSENVEITPGSGVTIGADSVTDITLGSAQIQYIKIMDGTIGGTNKAGVTSNGLAVDGSGVTQPISATSLPLPTGAATSSNQSSEISLLTTIASNTTSSGTPVVTGTVTVIQPTASNLNATVVQTVAGNLLTTAYLNDGSGNAISSTSGSLDVDVTNTVTISGTVTANAGTGTFQTNVTNASIPVTESGVWNITNITGTVSLPTGAATEATLLDVKSDLDQFTFSVNGLLVDGSGVTQPVSGTITAQQSIAANLLTTSYLNDGSGNAISSTTGSLNVYVTNASGLDTVNQGNPNTLANAWPVELSDGTNLLGTPTHPVRVDPTGTTTQPVSLTSTTITGTVAVTQSTSPWIVSGTVTANAGTGTFTVGQTTGTNLHTVVDSGTITVGNASIPVTQSGTWNITNISGTVSLPTGAATSANQTNASQKTQIVDGSGNVVASTSNSLNVNVTNTEPISGTVTANQGTPNTLANAWPVEITDGTNVLGTSSHPVRIDPTGTTTQPVSLTSTTITGTVAVTQSTSPWVVSLSSTTITGTVTVAGNLTHNNAAPVATNIGVLPAVASSATPTYTTGDQVLLSTDLSGNLRVTIDSTSAEQNVNLNQVGGSAISIGQAAMVASLPVVIASNQSSIPVTLTSTTITGTVAVTQSTSPWVVSGTVTTTPPANASTNITEWDSVALGAPSAYGTSPGAVNVIGVNAFITNTPTVTANQGTANATPWNENIAQVGGNAVATAATGIIKVGVTDGSGNSVTSTVDGSQRGLDSNIINIQDNMGTGTIVVLNSSVTAITNGSSVVNFQVTGTWSATLTIQGTVDGTTWNTIVGDVDITDTIESTITANTFVSVACGGFQQVRLTATAFTSGTVNIAWEASLGSSISEVYNTNPASLQATVTPIAITKGTQGVTGFTTQDLKDAGRTYVTFTADAVAGTTAETLLTLTQNRQGTTTSVNNYTITNGKTLRIQSIVVGIQAGSAAPEWIRLKLRHNTAGATTITSSLVITVSCGDASSVIADTNQTSMSIPDGLEFYGNGTQTIGFSHISSNTSNIESITIIGYEY